MNLISRGPSKSVVPSSGAKSTISAKWERSSKFPPLKFPKTEIFNRVLCPLNVFHPQQRVQMNLTSRGLSTYILVQGQNQQSR